MDECQKNLVNIQNLCRICGQEVTDSLDIFDGRGIELRLQEKLKLYTPILLDSSENMPKKICLECYDKVEIAQSLVLTSLQTDRKLRKLLNINIKAIYDSRYADLITSSSLRPDNYIDLNQLDATDSVQSHCNNLYQTHEAPSSKNDEKPNISRNSTIFESTQNLNVTGPNSKCMVESQKNLENHICNLEDAVNSEGVMQFKSNITCDICECLFDDVQIFEKHKSSCKLENPSEIKSQDFVESINNQAVNTDKKNVSESAKLQRCCGYCSSYFETKKDLQNHIADYHNAQPLYKCSICEKSYEKWSSLDVHEATHRNDKPYLCDLCGKSFKHSNNLRGHKRIHLDDSKKKRHVCEVCSSAFRSRFHLREHMNQHNDNRPYACESCGKAFYKRIQLRQHRLSHGSNKYACPICGVTFNRRGNMNTHLKRHDKVEGTYTCSVCEYKCKSMSELKMHRKQHSESDIVASIKMKNANKTTCQCKICDKVFPKRAVLLSHEITHTADRTRIECDKCGKKLANKSSLRYHVRSLHSTDRPHMCQFCGESFVSRSSRLSHERIHTGERPYVCEICNMRYRCSSNLNQHMKIHSSLKPYACQYCHKTFTRKGSMIVHERIHTGCKAFTCPICARAFSQKNDMIKHTKTHQSKLVQCEKCDKAFESKNDLLKHLNEHEENVDDHLNTEYAIVTETLETYIGTNNSSLQQDIRTNCR